MPSRDSTLDGGGPLHLSLAARVARLGQVCQQVDLAGSEESIMERIQKTTLDALALQTQVTHGLEVQVLVTAVQGLVGHFEERVIGIVEQVTV